MFDLFFLQAFIVNTLVATGIIFLHQKIYQTTDKKIQILPFILFPILYFIQEPILQASIIISTILITNTPSKNITPLTLVFLSTINASLVNYPQILFLNFITFTAFLVTQSKLINKKHSKKIQLTLDGLEWTQILNRGDLQQKLLQYLPNTPKKIQIIQIDETNDSVQLEITYEQ